MSAWALAKLKRVPFVFELGYLARLHYCCWGNEKQFYDKYPRKTGVVFYRQADLVIAVTHSFKFELQNRGVLADKIKVVLNGVDVTKYKPMIEKDEGFSKRYQLKENLSLEYIGTHGLAHALDTIIDTAKLLKDDDDIRILFAGGGADKFRLTGLVEKYKLKNVVMIPRQTKEKTQELWSLCDISLVTFKKYSIIFYCHSI